MAGNKIISLIDHAKDENLADITAMLQVIEDEFNQISDKIVVLTERLEKIEERFSSTT